MNDTTLPAILDRIRTGMATAEDADRIEAMIAAPITMSAAVAAAAKDTELWCRPVSMRGSGRAYAVVDGDLCLVPYLNRTPGGPHRAFEITGEWEVVEPGDVFEDYGL